MSETCVICACPFEQHRPDDGVCATGKLGEPGTLMRGCACAGVLHVEDPLGGDPIPRTADVARKNRKR